MVIVACVVPPFLSSVSRLFQVMAAAFMFFHFSVKMWCLLMAVLIVGSVVCSSAQGRDCDLPAGGTEALAKVTVLQGDFVPWLEMLLRF